MPIASFVVTFREALEAALIFGIVAAYVNKVGHPEAKRYLYLGAASAVTLTIIFAWTVQALYGGLAGAYESLFEGLTAMFAAGFLTYMILWMTKNSMRYKGDLERKLDTALTGGQLLGVAAIAFFAVFREGIESVLFLTAIFFVDPAGTSVGIAFGLMAVTIVAAAVVKSSHRLDLHSFFKYTSMILLVFAAGLVAFASHELTETAETLGLNLGILGQQAFNISVAPNSILQEDASLGSLLSTLFGYTLNPEWIRLAVYLGYWLVVGGYLVFAHQHVSSRIAIRA
jgi:high-affinity iron transporter